MTGKNHDAEYDPARNSSGCYALAVRETRLEKIRAGLLNPRENDPQEMEAKHQELEARHLSRGNTNLPIAHRVSA